MSTLHSRDSALVERLGRLAAGEGLPRIGGRMLGLLTLAAAPQSIDDLAKSLKVSRASISTNGKLLQSLGLVERVTRPGDRRDYLQVSGDPAAVLLVLGLRRLHAMREVVHTLRLTARRGSGARSRIRRMESLYDNLIARLQLELAR